MSLDKSDTSPNRQILSTHCSTTRNFNLNMLTTPSATCEEEENKNDDIKETKTLSRRQGRTFDLAMDSESDTPKATSRSAGDLSISFERSSPSKMKLEAESEERIDS